MTAEVHGAHFYAPGDICFGMRYTDAVTTAEDGAVVVDMTKIGALEPGIGDRPKPGWTELEEVR